MYLIRPSTKYKESFLDALNEYQKEDKDDRHNRNEHYNNLDTNLLKKDFEGYVKAELLKEKGIGLPKGWVPETVLWLIDGDKFIGKINVRHRLTESLIKLGGHMGYDIRPSKRGKGYGKKMLGLALVEAKKMGIKDILITCNFDNFASKKIIESNGGQFKDRVGTKLRYHIISE